MWDNEAAVYTGGIGTTLTFSYTVKQGDVTSDLQVTGLGLPNGATIKDATGNALSGPVSQDLALQIDTINPIVTSIVASPSTGNFSSGTTITITLSLSRPVKVSGNPSLSLNDGGTASYISSTSKPAAGLLVFNYTVGGGQSTPMLAITGVNLPTGATVNDAARNPADFTNAITSFAGLTINATSASSLQGFDAPSDSLWSQAQQIANNYQFVVVYLGTHKDQVLNTNLTLNNQEIQSLLGTTPPLQIASVYETENMGRLVNVTPTEQVYDVKYFTEANGENDGEAAFKLAMGIGQPSGSAIYFGIDVDPANANLQLTAALSNILSYFRGVQEGFLQEEKNIQPQTTQSACMALEARYRLF
jgi:hypothetical protein